MHIRRMRLSHYLEKRKLGDAEFASLIGVDRSTVSRLRRTNQKPSEITLSAIVRATNGKVTANDFWLSQSTDRTTGQAA